MFGLFKSAAQIENEQRIQALHVEHSQATASILADGQLAEIKHCLLTAGREQGQQEQNIVNALNSLSSLLTLASTANQTCDHTISLNDHIISFKFAKGALVGVECSKWN